MKVLESLFGSRLGAIHGLLVLDYDLLTMSVLT